MENYGFLRMVMTVLCLMIGMLVEMRVGEAASLEKIEFTAKNLFPESFDWDRKRGRFILGSADGSLVSVSKDGRVEEVVRDAEYAGKARILGVTLDRSRSRVLAVVQTLKEDGERISGLAGYDVRSWKRVLWTRLDANRSEQWSQGNDVTVDEDGNAYVSDTLANLVWKVSLSGSVFKFASFPQKDVVVRKEIAHVGLNGILFHGDGFLLVCQTNSGALFKVDLATITVGEVKLEESLTACDGLAWRSDGSLVVVSTQTSWLLASRDGWKSAKFTDVVPLDQSRFTTGVTTHKYHVYVLPSYLHEAVKGINRESFVIHEIEFPGDSDNNPLWLLMILGLFCILALAWRFQMNQFNTNYTKKRM